MKIAILERNKLGFINVICRRASFGPNLADLWEHCNTIVLSWIMNYVSKELLSGIVYSSDASSVWNDLKERFDKFMDHRFFSCIVKSQHPLKVLIVLLNILLN